MLDEEKDVNTADPSPADVTTDGNAQAQDTGKSAETLNTDTNPDAPGPVPYSRFQEVNSRKTELERMIEERDAELRDFRSKQTAVPPSPSNQKPKFSDPATQAFYEASILPLEADIKSAKEYREQQEAESQANAVLREIDGLIAKPEFKEADKDWVIGKLIANPKMKISDLVRISHEREAAKWKTRLDVYLKGKKEDAMHKAKSPAGSAPAGKPSDTKGKSFNERLKEVAQNAAARFNTSD